MKFIGSALVLVFLFARQGTAQTVKPARLWSRSWNTCRGRGANGHRIEHWNPVPLRRLRECWSLQMRIRAIRGLPTSLGASCLVSHHSSIVGHKPRSYFPNALASSGYKYSPIRPRASDIQIQHSMVLTVVALP